MAVPSRNYLSDLGWSIPTNAWGPIEKDRSNGEKLARDGRTLTIQGKTFAKGLGMHAGASVSYMLSRRCSTFTASVGLDDEVGDRGSVLFRMDGDGVELTPAVLRRGTDGPQPVSININGVNELKLVAADNGDGITSDHADWADAQVSCRGYTVNAIYLRLVDRPDRSGVYLPAVTRALQHLQRWYADQNRGLTFQIGSVRTANTAHPAGWYATSPRADDQSLWFFYNALDDALRTLQIPADDSNISIVYADADPNCGQLSGAGGNSRSVMSANDLRGLVGYTTEPVVKTYASDPDSSYDYGVLRWVDGTGHEPGHEPGHALGPAYPASCSQACPDTDLMGAGFYRYPATGLTDLERSVLAQSPFIRALTLPAPAHQLNVRTYNIDDISRVFVNGQRMVQFGYGDDTGLMDLSPWVNGPTTLRLTSQNTGGSYAYGFTVVSVSDGRTVLQQACGTVGSVSCAGDGRTGVVYDQTLAVP